jgi:hypothetical protein
MNYTKILEAINAEYDEICSYNGAFGQWISGLWSWFPELTIDEQKEAFLILLKRLLDEGKVYLTQPRQPKYNTKDVFGYLVWAAPHEEIIAHIIRHWPQDVKDENDIKLTDFWYDPHCPVIMWYDAELNTLVGS